MGERSGRGGGYSPAALAYFSARGVDAAVAAEVGVTEREGKLTYPYTAADGSVYGRTRDLSGTRTVQPRGRPLDLWRPTGRTGPAVLVGEGEPDALAALTALRRAPLDYLRDLPVVAVPGTGFPTERLAAGLAAAEAREAFLAFDGDEAGRTYAARAAETLAEAGVGVVTVELPDGSDLADCLAAADDPGEWLASALVDAEAAAAETARAVDVDAAELLSAVAGYLRRYVAMSPAQAAVVACWALHTHAIDAAETTPYLAITSPEKQSGKTRLLEALNLIVAAPWLTGSVSAAVLARKAAAATLLLDESDAAFKGDAEYAESLRGILNTGYRRGGVYSRCAGNGADLRVADFPTFSPKAIAGIGKLPDTVADRSIPVELRRRAPGERVERFREREVRELAEPIRARCEAWTQGHRDELSEARPEIPESLSDRAADCCEPLLAIADLAGGDWPQTVRAALVELYGRQDPADDTVGVRLLADIRDVLGDLDRMATADLLADLHAIEEAPWGDWYGRPLAARGLAKLLRRYGITSRSIRLDGGDTPKGYLTEQFADSWARYLPSEPYPPPSIRHNATTRTQSGIEPDLKTPQDGFVADKKTAANPHEYCVVADVADSGRQERGQQP